MLVIYVFYDKDGGNHRPYMIAARTVSRLPVLGMFEVHTDDVDSFISIIRLLMYLKTIENIPLHSVPVFSNTVVAPGFK